MPTQTPEEMEKKFLTSFSSSAKVLETFSPKNWAYFMERKRECIIHPTINIYSLDNLYNDSTLAKTVIKNNLVSVYLIATGKDSISNDTQNMLDISAPLILRTIGRLCDLYAMMIFFGTYVTEYKNSFRFDINEIQSAFNKKFVPYWMQKKEKILAEYYKEWVKTHQHLEPVGQEAKMLYLRDKVLNGEDLRSGGLYDYGQVSEAEIKQAEEMAKLFKSTVQVPPISEPEPQFPESANVNDWPF